MMDLAIAFFKDENSPDPVAPNLIANDLAAAKHLARSQFAKHQAQYGATIARVIDLDEEEVLYIFLEPD